MLTLLCRSGEGVPDILMLLVQLTQKLMEDKLMYISEVQVSEVLGSTCICINSNLCQHYGSHFGDTVVVYRSMTEFDWNVS